MNLYNLLYKTYITWSCQIILILNLDYSKNVPSSCINYVQYKWGYAVQIRHIFSTSEDVQYKQVRSSVLAQGVLLKIVSNDCVIITPTNVSGENG